MADIFWKALAAAVFIAVMTALRFVFKWSLDGVSLPFLEGLLIGGFGVGGFMVLVDKLERKGWLD